MLSICLYFYHIRIYSSFHSIATFNRRFLKTYLLNCFILHMGIFFRYQRILLTKVNLCYHFISVLFSEKGKGERERSTIKHISFLSSMYSPFLFDDKQIHICVADVLISSGSENQVNDITYYIFCVLSCD